MNMTDSILMSKPEYSFEEGWHVSTACITVNGVTHQLRFKASEGPITESADPFLAAVLFPVMKIGQPLHIMGKVSPKLLESTQKIQAIFHRWFPEYQKISVMAEPGLSDRVSGTAKVGAFFSGGVDSFYTLLKHQEEINTLILMHGFDISLEKNALRSRISREIRQIAREVGKPLIEVETNVFEFARNYGYLSNLLPCIGLLLAPQFKKIYIASHVPYNLTFPDTIHPLLDPLWSTEVMRYVHDGCEASRTEKIDRVAQYDIAMRSLRVCFENRDDAYNCGVCEKCLRTMIALEAIGALKRCATFDNKIEIHAVSHMILRDQLVPFAEENLFALEKSGNNPKLIKALRFSIQNYKHKKMTNQLNEDFREFLDSPQGFHFLRGKKNSILKSLWEIDRQWLFREVCKEKVKKLDRKYLFGIGRRLYGTNINK